MRKPTKTPRTSLPGISARTIATARMGMGLGAKLLVRTFRPDGTPKVTSDEAAADAASAAHKLLDQLDDLKGLLMKFGQMASYLEGALPPSAQAVLARLQAAATPMASDVIAKVVADDLGGRPEDLFDSFDPTPAAAASIGQVHRAVYQGRAVAVKIQYPGMERMLSADLTAVGALARLGLALSPVDGKGIVAELRERMIGECDYRREAHAQRKFSATVIAGREDAAVPGVIAARSGRRVLTTEWSDGVRFADFIARSTQAQRDRAGATIFDVCFRAIFRHGLLNGDPHPGNYLFEDGRVVFLDFGCVREFDATLISRWRRMASSIIDGDRATFRDVFTEAGFVGRARGFDWDAQWDCMRFVYEPVTTPRFTFTHEYVRRSFDVLLFDNKNKLKSNVPPEWLFVNRLQWGLYSVLAMLGATADWGSLMRAALAD
jgi:predicted unusual protein kinase regulating ubiquinone biosynthesis (AarF/ABC1/UbiB family)